MAYCSTEVRPLFSCGGTPFMKNRPPARKGASWTPGITAFAAGVAAGAWCLARKKDVPAGNGELQALRHAATTLEARVAAHEAASAGQFSRLESRIEEHAVKLAELPSTTQIVAAMEQLLVRTMSQLEHRLTSQGRSIDILKTTVAQTDRVLERILESVDSMHPVSDLPVSIEDELLQLTR